MKTTQYTKEYKCGHKLDVNCEDKTYSLFRRECHEMRGIYLWDEQGLFSINISMNYLSEKEYNRTIDIRSQQNKDPPAGLVKLLTENGFSLVRES